MSIVDIDARHQNAGWRRVTFADGSACTLTISEIWAKFPGHEVMSADDETLLKAYAALTHHIDAADNDREVQLRVQRQEIADEILRRMGR